jgi:hypothetical protein
MISVGVRKAMCFLRAGRYCTIRFGMNVVVEFQVNMWLQPWHAFPCANMFVESSESWPMQSLYVAGSCSMSKAAQTVSLGLEVLAILNLQLHVALDVRCMCRIQGLYLTAGFADL